MSLLIIAAAAVLAGAIQNIAGFGAGIILMLVLPYFFDMVASPALNAAICTGMTIILALKFKKWMNPQLLLLPLICYLITSLGIIWIVRDIDLRFLAIAFGIFLIVLAIYFMFFQKNLQIRATPGVAICCGLAAGALSALFSIGAPAMALYFLAVSDSREGYMGNLQPLLAITNLTSLSARIVRGIYTWELVLPTVVGFAGILTGQWIGARVSGKLNAEKINRFIYALVAFSGAVTLAKQLF